MKNADITFTRAALCKRALHAAKEADAKAKLSKAASKMTRDRALARHLNDAYEAQKAIADAQWDLYYKLI
jgi:hypothetical protein